MSNIFRAFLELLPARPLQVGTVLSVADGIARVELPGGGILQARGQATSGQRVFVRDGLVEGAAPDLPVVMIEI
ncbi:hypothetical protein [Polaromonas naphthalenivorans]|uniref:Uncharacterized protein n=1 Tax=Polaromonas naphthalenivorans (strain CJ2) TaxID=365044 RepID=A1VPH1_POLNA|nr:hypothetical protein [Polaromonas naphthalenivorans]ABM37549.1 conserved hypothetical protein [Polaromonas naphthalenivorans CJ2]